MRAPQYRDEAIRLLRELLDRINQTAAEGGDIATMCEMYRAAGDAIVDGRPWLAKALLTGRSRPWLRPLRGGP